MNIAVINIRDLFKYILKFCLGVLLIIILKHTIKGIIELKGSINIKEKMETSMAYEKAFIECLDESISLFSYKKPIKISKKNLLTANRIISFQTGILDDKVLGTVEKNVAKNEIKAENIEEQTSTIEEIPKEVIIESVSENNIEPRFTDTYEDVQINNQSDYEITYDMLVPDVEITNKKDILIYHTHTCESYTPSERI